MNKENKPKKKANILLKILGLIVILLVLIVIGILTFIDQIARNGIETAGSMALGTSATLEKADIQILKGQVVLENMKIANPDDYQTPDMLDLDLASCAVDINSLTSDTVIVKSILIDGLTLTIEQKGLTTNVQEILDHLSKMSPEETETQKNKEEAESGKKLKIEKIAIKNAGTRIKLIQGLGGSDKGMVETKLGEIVLTDIGGDKSNAVLATEVIREILIAVTKATVDANPQDIPANLLNNLTTSVKMMEITLGKTTQEALKNAEKISKDVLDKAGKALEGGTEGVKGAVDSILKDPDKLLGSPKDKEKQ